MIAALAIGVMVVTPSAQSSGPATQPRLTVDSLIYIGGFRMPSSASNGDTFEFGGRALTFNPVSNSLFVGSRVGRVAEVSIPGAVKTSNPAAMPQASYLQPFSDPTEGHLHDIQPADISLDGLLVYNNKLYGSASSYYDALNEQRVSHYSRSLQLNAPSFSGWSSVWDPAKTGFVSGMMSLIPTEWQALLGGPAVTGQCCIPIVSRTSWGPGAFAFNPAQLGATTAPATPLLYYTGDHHTLGDWAAQNSTYGQTTFMGGMAIIAGTRTALYLGRNGMGAACYGNGTSDPALAGTLAPDGAHYCYDPTNSDKGTHAYPYRYQIWAYDLNDFAAVKAGTKQPWDVVPYGVWPLDLPTPEPSTHLGGVGYDAQHQLLYVSQMYADKDGYAFRPIVHVIQINAAPGSTDSSTTSGTTTSGTSTTSGSTTSGSTTSGTTTAPAPAPAPTDANTVLNSITISSDRVAPQRTNTSITFAAFATGTGSTQEYKWLVDDGTGPKAVTTWSANDKFTWTPASANANYRVSVWSRDSGHAADAAEASASTRYAITAPPAIRSVTFGADKPAPQPLGASITFTATADGGDVIEYKWLIHDGNSWAAVTGWSTDKTFTWTPATANPYSRVGVWVRNQGSTKDEGEQTASIDYAITPPPPPAIQSVIFAADKPAPQPAGSSITFTATVSGGGVVEYKWLIHDGLNWNAVTGWSTDKTFTWTPSTANPYSRVGLWVRNQGKTVDAGEQTFSIDYPISAVTVPSSPIRSVTFAADKPAPQPAGSSITFTATVDGGGVVEYKWLIHDGNTWNAATGWSTARTFNWTPVAANPYSRVGLWVRNQGNTTDAGEQTFSIDYATTAAPAAPIQWASFTADKPAPQPATSTITFTATVGGGGTVEYKWLVHDGYNWVAVTGWSTSKTFVWTPATANPYSRVGLWVRNQGNTTDGGEQTFSIDYPIH